MKNYIEVCFDGAAAMIGEKLGIIIQIKQLAPECASTLCFMHRESLATKKLSMKLNDVLCGVVKLLIISKEMQLIQDYLPFYATICKHVTVSYYFILLCIGCQGGKFYQAYMGSRTNWQYFCVAESLIGQSYF